MRYDVRTKGPDGSEGQFDHEQDEELKVDDPVRASGMSYRVWSVRPLGVEESNEYDAVVEADWALGPAEAAFHAD